MKIRKYILLVATLFLLTASVAAGGCMTSGKGRTTLLDLPERTTILCVGLDEAAGNTDVLMLIGLDFSRKEITVLQIPRDTYFFAESVEGKINRLYPVYRAAGEDRESAMMHLTAEISDAFGITIDHYVAADFASVSYLVDRLGGLTVNIPSDVFLGDKTITAGERLLMGEDALAFIRHRAGYAEGDIGRLDAQKLLFLSAYKKLKNELSLTDLVLLIPDLYKRITTDMTVSGQISLAYSYARGRTGYTVQLLTLPGAATRANGDTGTWYYVANKKATEAALVQYFGSCGFDPDGRMTDTARAHIAAIYDDDNVSFTVYTEETIDNLEIKTD